MPFGHIMIAILFAIARCSADEGLGGFVTFNFSYGGDKAELLSQLSVVVKTPHGSIVDTSDVLPTGNWLISTPSHRELVVSVHGPEGIVFAPQKQSVNFPFDEDINFAILGFSIRGQITTKTAQGETMPVSASLTVEVSNSSDFCMRITSASDGTFVAGPLSSGTYTIHLKDAIADNQTVVVTNAPVVSEPLLISDWPHSGKIVFPEGVKPRKLRLNLTGAAHQTFETDSDGFFLLKNLNVGRYFLGSGEDSVAISQISFTVSVSELPNQLTASFLGITVRGSVKFPDGKPLEGVLVRMLHASKSTKSDKNGEFVFFEVQPCEKPEIVAELPFTTFSVAPISPISTSTIENVAITVVNACITGVVECYSAKITVSGAIETAFTVTNKSFSLSAPYGKEVTFAVESECGFETNIISTRAPSNSLVFQRIRANVTGSVKCLNECSDVKIVMSNVNNNYVINTAADGSFFSSEIEFGEYSISLNAPAYAIFDYKKSKISIKQKVNNVGIVAEQTSYKFHVTSSHLMNVTVAKNVVLLNRGTNDIVVKGTVVSPGDCHIFEPVDLRVSTRIIVTAFERTVYVTGETQQSNYEIYVDQKPISSSHTFTQGLTESVPVQVEVNSPFYVEPPPTVVRTPQDCDNCGVYFTILRGKEYRGKIFPAIEGVVVTAKTNGEVISTVVTSSNGEYTLGSHPSNVNIVLSATKIGYSLKQRANSNDFDAEKLASITALFANSLADGALVSLTRADGFKQKTIVQDSTATFDDLTPGNYFINSVKREYQFTPKMFSVKLETGQDSKCEFQVLRTRFGISGTVKRITGEPEPDIEITAIHQDGEKTTNVTDANGEFRLGNLMPNMTYTVLAAATGTSVAGRITPETLKIKLEENDFDHARFLSIRPSKSFDILGEVDIASDFLDKLNIILMKENGVVVDRFQFPSKSSNFFYFTNLTEDHYVITAASTRQGITDLNCPPINVERAGSNANVVMKCGVVQTVLKQNGNAMIASFIALLLLVSWMVFFNFNTIKEAIAPHFEKKKRL